MGHKPWKKALATKSLEATTFYLLDYISLKGISKCCDWDKIKIEKNVQCV